MLRGFAYANRHQLRFEKRGNQQQDHCTNYRINDRADDAADIENANHRQQPTGNQTADNADDDIPIRSFMMRWVTRSRRAPVGLEISVFRIPGRARFRQSGRTPIATSTSTTHGTARTGTVETGVTGRTWPATVPCKQLTATIASWVELTMSSTLPDIGSGPRRSSQPVCWLTRSPRRP